MSQQLRDIVRSAIVGCALVTAVACGGSERTPAEPAQAQAAGGAQASGMQPGGMQPGMQPGGMPGGGMHGMATMCPNLVSGTSVRTEDIEGGVAMIFTTSSGDVADLRTRVRATADMHNQMAARGMGPGGGGRGMGPGGGGRGMGPGGMGRGMMMVLSTATAVDVDQGARLELRPRDPAQLDQLRVQTRMHSQQMASGQCPRLAPRGGTEQAIR